MSINWQKKFQRNRFLNGIDTSTINEINPGDGVSVGDELIANGDLQVDNINEITSGHGVDVKDSLIASGDLKVDSINPKDNANVNIQGNLLKPSGYIESNLIEVDVIEEKTTSQGVSFTNPINIDTIKESTSTARVSFPDSIKTDEIQAYTGGSNIVMNNNVDMADLRVNSINKLTSNLTLNLGHTNSSNLSYFEAYTNPSQLTDQTNPDTGVIEAGDLNILRINEFCMLTLRFVSNPTPTDGFADFNIPARFQPTIFYSNRCMAAKATGSNFIYGYVDNATDLRIGHHNFSGSLVNFGNNAEYTFHISYFVSNNT